jgi:hypothetical protein
LESCNRTIEEEKVTLSENIQLYQDKLQQSINQHDNTRGELRALTNRKEEMEKVVRSLKAKEMRDTKDLNATKDELFRVRGEKRRLDEDTAQIMVNELVAMNTFHQ